MSRRRERGFVLVLVLAMLVVLGLLAGTIAAITGRLLEQSQQRGRAMQDAVDIANTRATVLYLLATQRMTLGGLTVDNMVSFGEGGTRAIQTLDDLNSSLPVGTEISLDGGAHRGQGNARFSLQDDFGLFGVNWQPPPALERLLAQGGAERPLAADTLINRLMDYQDRDDLYRINSMEADGYRSAGLPPPTNLPLATPMEVLRVAGWKDALGFMSPGQVSDTITVEPSIVVNVNTAPVAVLRTLEGMDADKAARAIAYRKLQPFMTETDFSVFMGLPKSTESPVAVYPAASGTLKLWPSQGGRVVLVHWTLTPFDDRGHPWREDYELIQSQTSSASDDAVAVRSRLFRQPVAAQR